MATSESETSGKTKMTREKRGVPGGLWIRCDDCGETIFRKEAGTVELLYDISEGKPFKLGRIIVDARVQPWHAEAVARAMAARGKIFLQGITDHLISHYIRGLQGGLKAKSTLSESPAPARRRKRV